MICRSFNHMLHISDCESRSAYFPFLYFFFFFLCIGCCKRLVPLFGHGFLLSRVKGGTKKWKGERVGSVDTELRMDNCVTRR